MKGNQMACVQRQHRGALGKTENCVVSVHLGYAAGEHAGGGIAVGGVQSLANRADV
ncbi:MAG: transposase [Phycisphaerae bacterium]|nr:transposase [Phycisphaerae bacterium]